MTNNGKDDRSPKERLKEYLKEKLRQRLRQRMREERARKEADKLDRDIRIKRHKELFDLLSKRVIDEYIAETEKMPEIPLPEQIEVRKVLSGDKTFIYQIRIKPKKRGQNNHDPDHSRDRKERLREDSSYPGGV